MKHEYYDICVTGVEASPLHHKELATINLDPTKEPDGEPLKYIYLTPKDIAEIAKLLDLVVYHKDEAL